MPSGLPDRRSRISLLITFLVLVFSHCAAAAIAEEKLKDTAILEIPGGVAPVARLLAMNGSEPITVERIFKSILDSEPSAASISGVNARRTEVIAYLRQYAELLQFFRNNRLAESGEPQVLFSFTGNPADLARTQKLLSFFSIRSRIEKNSSTVASIVVPSDVRAASRSSLSKALGLLPGELGEKAIRVSQKTETLPMILTPEKWRNLLRAKDSVPLLRTFVENPDSMRLYLALSSCAPETREMLLTSVPPSQLLKASNALTLFGEDLQIEESEFVFPGTRAAWISLAGSASRLSGDLLLSNKGLPLLLYSVVRAAPVPVQAYLTASPERLREYYQVLKPYASGTFSTSMASAMSQELLAIFRMSAVSREGLFFSLQGPAALSLLNHLAPGAVVRSSTGSVAITPKLVARLLPPPAISPYSVESNANLIEFFLYLQQNRPAMLFPEVVDKLTQNPAQTPVFLELLGDLELEPRLLASYLEYCTKTASISSGWKENRARTSQSIFFLLSMLFRHGSLTVDSAAKLLADALESFNKEDEGVFALSAARFISTRLLPELSAQPHTTGRDPVLAGLSGSLEPDRVSYLGRELVLNSGARRYLRMQRTLATQSHTPMIVLLELYALLQKVHDGKSAGTSDDVFRLFTERLNALRTAEWTPGDSGNAAAAAQSDIDTIKRTVASGRSWATSPAAPSLQARQIAAQLHTELGITLLAYCYAYGATPEWNMLAYDPNFVRRHRFYSPGSLGKSGWSPARFVQEEGTGGGMVGSLAGLTMELTRMQAAQPLQESGMSLSPQTVPPILVALRQAPSRLRTVRSQEYVALATGLGRKLLSLSTSNTRLNGWIQETLRPLLSQRRLDELLKDPNTDELRERVSSSELFLLGHSYFSAGDWRMEKCADPAFCKALEKLDAMVPKPGSLDYNQFEQEVSRYGPFLYSRIGLSRFSLDRMDSYERLEKSLWPQLLYDRMCDLKIRIAELNHEMGLPPALEEVLGDLAMPLVMASQPGVDQRSWKETIRLVNSLSLATAEQWMDEIIRRVSGESDPDTSRAENR